MLEPTTSGREEPVRVAGAAADRRRALMPNRLAHATSPYLLQHADNPVDWWEWGDAAFADARDRDVPVLLSVGYAACHWCHVMAHESFEDPRVAAFLNANFLAVKTRHQGHPAVHPAYIAAATDIPGHARRPVPEAPPPRRDAAE